MKAGISADRYASLLLALLLAVVVANPSAQTPIAPDKNSYSIADDIKLGRTAEAEARKQLPMLNDDRVDAFVENIGAHLAAAIPGELRHEGFHYTFDVVNQKEINAFALPGGPMFLNRGMIEAAASEAEVAGVMAHEIAHVALRHGTAQATKGQKFAIGSVAGQILGAVVGGAAGTAISQGSQLGLGAYFLKYGREYERQADLMGAQIMARAGYDPRQMANMFRTLEAKGGGGGPEWLSSHPNPGNRYEAILNEASLLRVEGNGDSGQFQSIKSRLAGMSPAYTAAQIAEAKAGGRPVGKGSPRVVRVEPPANSYRTYQPSDFLRISVPANWNEVAASAGSVTYAPDGGFIEGDNGSAFTHGVQIGVVQGAGGDLQQDTQQLLKILTRANPNLRAAGKPRRESIGGRQGITTPLSNVSPVTGAREYVALSTLQLRDGGLLHIIGVAPESEAKAYEKTFRYVRQSLQIAD